LISESAQQPFESQDPELTSTPSLEKRLPLGDNEYNRAIQRFGPVVRHLDELKGKTKDNTDTTDNTDTIDTDTTDTDTTDNTDVEDEVEEIATRLRNLPLDNFKFLEVTFSAPWKRAGQSENPDRKRRRRKAKETDHGQSDVAVTVPSPKPMEDGHCPTRVDTEVGVRNLGGNSSRMQTLADAVAHVARSVQDENVQFVQASSTSYQATDNTLSTMTQGKSAELHIPIDC
jgi:hypothetical protein